MQDRDLPPVRVFPQWCLIDDPEKDVPKVASNGLCLGCHRLLIGRPKDQPQVAPADHKKSDPQKRTECVSCHKPHWPKTDA